MNIPTMIAATALSVAGLTTTAATEAAAETFIGRQMPKLSSDRMTPEALWAMGRIGTVSPNAAGTHAVYAVSYYSVAENKSHSVLYLLDIKNKKSQQLTTSAKSESGAVWVRFGNEERIVFLSSESGSSQLWTMKADGSERKQITHEEDDVVDFLFAPNGKRVILVKEVPQHTAIAPKEADLPKATGMVINDLMYKHWDQYVTSAPHPFLAEFDGERVTVAKDLLEGKPFESPMMPFGGNEQLAWSPNSEQVAYTCRKKVGRDYATSTDSDIFLYDIPSGTTRNLCKPEGWTAPTSTDYTKSLQHQAVNQSKVDANVGYDINPQFSPDGKSVAWSSMERDGYESDRARLCVYDLKSGKKTYVTESFDSGVDGFAWGADSKQLFFVGVWHGKANLHVTNLQGKVRQITNEQADYSLVAPLNGGKQLLTKRHSMAAADEIFLVDAKTGRPSQLTEENKYFYVWMDAPFGYLASYKNLCNKGGAEDHGFYKDKKSIHLVHFIGKDILRFHSIFWPIVLDAANMKLPSQIVSHGFVTVNGEKMSKSKGTFITARKYLSSNIEPEFLRYYFASKMNNNENDINFDIDDFVRVINNELIGKIINIPARLASVINKAYEGKILNPISYESMFDDPYQFQCLSTIESIETDISSCNYSNAISRALKIADKINARIESVKIWKAMSEDCKDSLKSNIHEHCSELLILTLFLFKALSPIMPKLYDRFLEFMNISNPKAPYNEISKDGYYINSYEHLYKRLVLSEVKSKLLN